MRNEGRMLLTRNSRGFRTVSCPMVGKSVLGRITAAKTWKAMALELAVEKMAEPVVRMTGCRLVRCATCRLRKWWRPWKHLPLPDGRGRRKQSRQGRQRKRPKEGFAAESKIELQRRLYTSTSFSQRIVSRIRSVN